MPGLSRLPPTGWRRLLSARESLGLTLHTDGRIADVAPGLPGDKAGLAPGMRVLGINSKKFSRERLDDALADSVALCKIEFLLLDGEQFRTVTVEYADGLRYLELGRNQERPDVLGEILKPVASRARSASVTRLPVDTWRGTISAVRT